MDDLLGTDPGPLLHWVWKPTGIADAQEGLPGFIKHDPGIRVLSRMTAILGMCFSHWDYDWRKHPLFASAPRTTEPLETTYRRSLAALTARMDLLPKLEDRSVASDTSNIGKMLQLFPGLKDVASRHVPRNMPGFMVAKLVAACVADMDAGEVDVAAPRKLLVDLEFLISPPAWAQVRSVRVVHTLPSTATPAEALGVDMLDQYSGCGEWSCGLPAAELWLDEAHKTTNPKTMLMHFICALRETNLDPTTMDQAAMVKMLHMRADLLFTCAVLTAVHLRPRNPSLTISLLNRLLAIARTVPFSLPGPYGVSEAHFHRAKAAMELGWFADAENDLRMAMMAGMMAGQRPGEVPMRRYEEALYWAQIMHGQRKKMEGEGGGGAGGGKKKGGGRGDKGKEEEEKGGGKVDTGRSTVNK